MTRCLAWLLLGVCPLLSGCYFTWQLWERGIGMHGQDFDGGTTADVLVLAEDQGQRLGFALQVDVSAVQHLARLPQDPSHPGDARAWLVVRPDQHHQAVAAMLALLAGHRSTDAELSVLFTGERSDGRWPGTLRLQVDTEWPGAVPIPAGLQVTADRVELETACALQLLDATPEDGIPWQHGTCRYGKEVHTGTPLAVKVLLTPGSVVLDVLTLPVQAICFVCLTIAFWNG